jgi:hypothetical protein
VHANETAPPNLTDPADPNNSPDLNGAADLTGAAGLTGAADLTGAALPAAGEPTTRRRADTAGRVAREWVDAWSHGNLDRVRTILSDNATIECNLGWPSDRATLLDILHRLSDELDSVALLSLTVAADRAAVLYDCQTREPAGTIRLAEFLDVVDEHVTGVRRVYDLTAVDMLLPDLRRPSTAP